MWKGTPSFTRDSSVDPMQNAPNRHHFSRSHVSLSDLTFSAGDVATTTRGDTPRASRGINKTLDSDKRRAYSGGVFHRGAKRERSLSGSRRGPTGVCDASSG